MKRMLIPAALLAAIAIPAAAAEDIDQLNLLTQTEFRHLSEDLGSALSYKAVTSAASLGIAGVDIGVEMTATKLQHPESWDLATSGDGSDTLYIAKAHFHKGLPFGFNVGGFYSTVPNSNISLWGAELRYAIIDGGVLMPTLGLRGTYTKLSGVNQLDLDTKGIELTLSKGFAFFTPYVGVGRVWITSTPMESSGLASEEFSQNKYVVGGNLNLGLVNLAVEGDRTGDATSFGVKFGWRF